VGVVVSFALYGMLFAVPLFLQAVHGHDALGTGLRLIPMMAGLIVAAPLADRLDRAVGTKAAVAAGLFALAAGLLALSQITVSTGPTAVALMLACCGLGTGFAMIPAMNAVMGAVPDGHAGAGAAVNNTLRQVGGALGVAILGSLLSSAYAHRLDPALAHLPAAQAHAARDSVVAAVADPALRAAASDAFVHGLAAVVLASAAAAVLAALACLRYLPGRA
jgi:MFS family permease